MYAIELTVILNGTTKLLDIGTQFILESTKVILSYEFDLGKELFGFSFKISSVYNPLLK